MHNTNTKKVQTHKHKTYKNAHIIIITKTYENTKKHTTIETYKRTNTQTHKNENIQTYKMQTYKLTNIHTVTNIRTKEHTYR